MKLSGRTRVYRFGEHTLDVAEHRLKRGEVEISLQPKAFETLVYLVERHGHLVQKKELLDAVWADVAVTEGSLSLRIKEIRQALVDDAQNPRFIKTIPTVGYKFIAAVQEAAEVAQAQTEAPGTPGRLDRPHRSSKNAVLRLLAVIAVVGVIAAAYSFLSEGGSPPGIQSIAVLPFKPLVSSGRDEVLEMAMADTLITKLNRIHQLIVRQLAAVRTYTNLQQDAVAAGRELGVDAVLDSSIQRSGDRIQVTVRLFRVEDAKQLWAEQFNEKFTNIFGVQDAIAEQIVRALAVNLTVEERALFTKHSTQNSAALEFYQRGRYIWAQGTEEGLTKAIDYFEEAIKIDPNYAQAYAGVADSYIMLGSHGLMSMTDSSLQATAAAEQALIIDEQLGEAHVSMGSIRAGDREWVRAEEHYKRAIALIPNDETAHSRYSLYLADAGRFDDAIREAKLAQDISPTSLRANHSLAYAFYMAKRYVEAIEQSRKTLDLDPKYPMAHIIQGLAYVKIGMHAKAASSLDQARQSSNSPDFRALLGYAHAMAGRRDEAQTILKELMELKKRRYVSAFPVAMIYAGLGERKLAIDWLDLATKDRAAHLAALRVDPAFEALREEPHFKHVLRQIGLSQ
jgi:DNA-binding winged helix-turn-helix (wHTH) protein/TolB-like protein/Flp pilus assembly protein TadD